MDRDPRHPPPPMGVPFARNPTSPPYGRSPFPPTSSSSPYPPTSIAHPSQPPPSASPAVSAYSEPQRRPSDPLYFPPRPPYAPDPTSHSAQSHSRHQSSSSVGALSRRMAPPSPPQQPPPHQIGAYGLASAPRGPPPNLGPPSAFPTGRELPALSSIPRTGNAGGSMSISAMLGGPAPREPTPNHPSSHPSFPPPNTTPTISASAAPFASAIHTSPRNHALAVEYDQYGRRRPQTPDLPRPYDARDQRGSTAGSPPQSIYGTPEVSRYGTPGAYPPRTAPVGLGDGGRDPAARMPLGALPPRPDSQPRVLPGMPGRPIDIGRAQPPSESMYGRREEVRPAQAEYDPERPPRALPYEEQRRMMEYDQRMREQMAREADMRERERERQERARFEEQQRAYMIERERMERERELEMRERERRERTASDPSHPLGQRPVEYGPPGQGPTGPPYGRTDPRDPAGWPPRPPVEQVSRGPYDPAYLGQRPGEFTTTTVPPYGAYRAHTQPPVDRYPPTGPPQHAGPTSQPGPPGIQPFSSPDEHRYGQLPPHTQHPPPQQPRQRPIDEGQPPPALSYNGPPGVAPFEATRPARPARSMEEVSAPGLVRQQSGGFLGIQEINRKGRISPLPQAVQGAQPQMHGPAGEPGIKSEFGRMFSGIGNGTIGFGVSSPLPAGHHLPFTTSGLVRRDDLDALHPEVEHEPVKNGARKRSRKAKDDEGKGDDDSTGRLTPAGRAKRAKTQQQPPPHHHHHHQYVPTPNAQFHLSAHNGISSHHHHHHHPEMTGSPLPLGATPLKGLTATIAVPPAGGIMKDLPTTHNHRIPQSNHHPSAKPAVPVPVVVPKPKKKVSSQAVLDSVAHKSRKHLGDIVYEPILKPAKLDSTSRFGYSSTPKPLPLSMIKDNENSTLTVKVPRVHLTPSARQEITERRALWGTEVYTDDSDVVAACIHMGWIMGEWGDDVDRNLLDLRPQQKTQLRNTPEHRPQEVLTAPPSTGPVQVPLDRDLHVTILILPALDKYSSMTQFGMTSREWGGTYNGRKSVHDGISFMVTGIRWVDGAAPQNRLRGRARRERIRKAMSEVHRAQVIDITAHKRAGDDKSHNVNGNGTRGHEEGDKENQPAETKTTVKASVIEDMDPGKMEGVTQDGDSSKGTHDGADPANAEHMVSSPPVIAQTESKAA